MKNLKHKIIHRRTIVLIICLFLLTFNLRALCQDTYLDGLHNYNYTANDNRIWDFIGKYQYGVAGSGFVDKDQFIGKCIAHGPKGGPWEPIDGYKRTLCGQLYLTKNGKFIETMDDDGDIDFYMYPDSAFEYLVLNSKNANGSDWVPGTILGEVAFKEPGNKIENDGATYLQSLPRTDYQNMGMYGAWVTDVDAGGGHDDSHAEIHPIEQMWQKKDINATATIFYLFSIHDNEGRFTTLDNFELSHAGLPPECLPGLPWLKNPQVNTFYIPFEATIKGTHINYNIDVLSSNNVNYVTATSQVQRLFYKGIEIISVKRPRPDFPKVTFYQVGMKNPNTLRGYIAIETSIANTREETRTKGAHVFLRVGRIMTSHSLSGDNK